MSLKKRKEDILSAAAALDNTRIGLNTCKEGIEITHEEISVLLSYLKGEVLPPFKEALEAYEKGIQLLVNASTTYNESVLPRIQAAGVAGLTTEGAQKITASIQAVGV